MSRLLTIIGKSLIASCCLILVVFLVAPLFNTSLIEILRTHKGWMITFIIAYPLIYGFIRSNTEHEFSKQEPQKAKEPSHDKINYPQHLDF